MVSVPALEGYMSTGMMDYAAPVVGEQEKRIIQQYLKQYSQADLEVVGMPGYNIEVL